MTDAKVAEWSARQAAQSAAMQSKVEAKVNAEIGAGAATSTPSVDARVEDVAAQIRGRAVADAEQGARTVGQARSAARWSQFMDYGFYVVYALLGVRLVLALIAARSASGFVVFIRAITDPFYAPFRGIVASPSVEGGYTLVLPIIVALVVYAILHAGLNGILRMVGHRKTAV